MMMLREGTMLASSPSPQTWLLSLWMMALVTVPHMLTVHQQPPLGVLAIHLVPRFSTHFTRQPLEAAKLQARLGAWVRAAVHLSWQAHKGAARERAAAALVRPMDCKRIGSN